MQETINALHRAVRPWWLPWPWRRRAAQSVLAELGDRQLGELRAAAARLYWHPNRRVDTLIWQVIDEAYQARGRQ